MSYSELLKDPRWQRKRLEVFQRDNFTCQLCGATERSLQVHHHFYLKNYQPWDYELGMLSTLCEQCHELASAQIDALRRSLANLRPRHLDRLIGYIDAIVSLDDQSWVVRFDRGSAEKGIRDASGVDQWWFDKLRDQTKANCISGAELAYMVNTDIEQGIDRGAEDVLP